MIPQIFVSEEAFHPTKARRPECGREHAERARLRITSWKVRISDSAYEITYCKLSTLLTSTNELISGSVKCIQVLTTICILSHVN